MRVRIEYKASVLDDLRSLDRDVAERILNEQESILSRDPNHGKLLEGQHKGRLKCDIGEYRFIYTWVRDVVLVLRIALRTPKKR
ncbi:MAG: type II toxin-antitoxin system RelE/ParE family toxin [Methanomicrobiales archaeon]|nr:type II toxin-antitoxin system RelE/ParE family toxin [Methanomicrobiales archaeon]MDD1669057.1 type II toxin-antitoxin system RelE/ParE family toxin [Methanomicrobiales archaeon]